ncbi:copia protein, partial [Tanacetum coccineum]
TLSDYSLPDYETFYFDDDHIEEKSSGSTTTQSVFYHEEFADELAHIISPPEYDCFYFKSEPDPGELTSIVDSEISENILSATNVNLPFEDDQSPLLAYVAWIFLSFLTISQDHEDLFLFSILQSSGLRSFAYFEILNPDHVKRIENGAKNEASRPLSQVHAPFDPGPSKAPTSRYYSKRFAVFEVVHDKEFNEQTIHTYRKYSEEEVVETMAETMERYMSKTRVDYGLGVARPKIDDKDNFELKGQFLKELQTNTFSSSNHEDANEHIEKVLEIVDLFHILNITIDQAMLRAFHMSLTGAASHWLRNKPTGLITTWDGLKTKFLNKYCPPAQTAKKMEEINNFQQEPDENLYQAWERFKEILMKCPQHYLTDMQKTTADAKVAIQEMVEYSPNGTMEHLEIRASTDAAIRNQGASIKTLEIQIGQMIKNRTLMYKTRQMMIPFPIHLNGYYCDEKKGSYGPQFSEAYAEASHINNSIPRKEKDPRSFTLPFFINNVCFDNALVDLGASVNKARDLEVLHWEFLLDGFLIQEVLYHLRLLLMRRQSSKKWLNTLKNDTMEHQEIQALTDAAIRNQGASIKTLEIQIKQMSKVLQERGFGSLPSSTKANPRDQVGSISTTIEADSYPICRASISIMPLSTYLNLGLGELAHTKLTVELADKTVKYPKGIVENVLLRRNQGDDLMPTIEEGEVIEIRTRDDELNTEIDDYPSYCDYDKKIHIDCAHNLKFSCMIGFEFMHAIFFPLLYVNVMSKKFHNSIMKDKMVYKENNVIELLMNVAMFG